MFLFLCVVFLAIAFEYINGFHDAANAIATVVSTKVLQPRQAIALAAFFNLTGALTGTAVASTIGKGMVDANVITMATVLGAHRRDYLEFSHVVARPAVELQSRADRRIVRRGGSVCGWQLGSPAVEQGADAEGGDPDDHLTDRGIRPRRNSDVRSPGVSALFETASCAVGLRQNAAGERGMDGAQPWHE